MDLEREVDRIYLQHYVPAGVVINEEMEVLQFRGQTGLFLEHRPGQATLNLLQMVKPHVAIELKNAILTVRHTGLPFGKAGLQTQLKGNTYPFSLDVFPLVTDESQNFLVVFNESELSVSNRSETIGPKESKEAIITPTPVAESNDRAKIPEQPGPSPNEASVIYQEMLAKDRADREKWLRTFSDVLPTMMCYTRADNTTLFFNAAWLAYTGRSEAREANGGWMLGIHPDDQPEFLQLYNRKSERGEPFETELRILRFDGEYCVVALNAVPLLSTANSFEGYMITYNEVAGKNVLPLGPDGFTSELLDHGHTSGPMETFIKTDLNAIVKKVVKEFEMLILEKQAQVQFDQLPIIHALPQQMEQLFYNLVSNALQFTRKGRRPEIKITAKKLSGDKLKQYQHSARLLLYYEIIVQDNGIGFSQPYASHVLTTFQRPHSKQEFPDRGMGLALCRKIVLDHKGDIYADSREHEGTKVHVILPARQD